MACCVGRGDWYTSAQWSQAMLRTLRSKRLRVPTSMPPEFTLHTGYRGTSVASGRKLVTPASSKVQASDGCLATHVSRFELLEIARFGRELQAWRASRR